MRNNWLSESLSNQTFNTLNAAHSGCGPTGFIAADVVFRDDNASLLAGDVAASGVLGLKIEQATWSAGLIESFVINETETMDFR